MWDIRTITEADADLYRDRISRGFGRDGDSDEASRERFAAIFEHDRTLAAFDEGDIVGTCAALSLDVTTPGGGEVPMGGTTIVTVQPTHRRRGILRALMERHLDEIADRGEPLAGLWASEGSIYGRFGYAPATFRYRAELDAGSLELTGDRPEGVVTLTEASHAEKTVRELYEKARPARAGMLSRSDNWWSHRLLADPESWRGGKTALRYALIREQGEPTGYATFRQNSVWDDFVSRGEVHVTEMITTTPGARRGLWEFLTNIDLFPVVEWWNMPVDDPLAAGVTSSRVVRRTLSDALWLRVMDVVAALEARSYEVDGDVSFEVYDESRPDVAGAYRLVVTGGRAECRRIERGDADIAFDIDVLGHLYLGGGNALVMADAGRITGDRSAVTRLHRVFRSDVAPWCPEVF
ncbi:MAG: GNAT family N-acetyltransferase [Acidimicrobiia bacterium]|jgi:predicted acetyltransferase